MNSLPTYIYEADISEWDNIQPEDFAQKEYLKTEVQDYFRADKLLKYSRLIENAAYDQLAYRLMAATPFIRAVKLQSLNTVRTHQQQDVLKRVDDDFNTLSTQAEYLAHRPIEMFEEGRANYTITKDLLKMWKKDDPDFSDITWIFPLSNVPKAILGLSSDRDLPELISQYYHISAPEIYWLPLSTLLDNGIFKRMQDYRHLLINHAAPGNYYCFISHRWLSPVHPDPDGVQAQILAWQLISYLSEAVRVAKKRGLHQPRKFSPSMGVAVGVAGSTLAESILVNVLRYYLDEDSLNEAFEETETLPLFEDDYGIKQAANDKDLIQLKQLLEDRPILKSLSEKILIWYDYSCMPQRPFINDEATIFLKSLEKLNLIQLIGQTAIMLDDADDYLGRAWCTLESVYADNEARYQWFTIAGSLNSISKNESMEHYFFELLEDRPHLIWRAILDTELFELQTPDTCMRRLGLSTTEADDLLLIYHKLKQLRMPVKIHVDDCEVITGVFPLPLLENKSQLLFSKETGRQINYFKPENIIQTKTLDWTPLLSLNNILGTNRETFLLFKDGYFQFPNGNNSRKNNCHVCIIASCEGEALLLSNWLYRHIAEVEGLQNLMIGSLSWIASDIAPVGKIVNGQLKTVAVDYPVWILVAGQARFTNCNTANMIMNCVRSADKQMILLEYDRPTDNVTWYKKTAIVEDAENRIMIRPDEQFVHNGGLFRWALPNYLLK